MIFRSSSPIMASLIIFLSSVHIVWAAEPVLVIQTHENIEAKLIPANGTCLKFKQIEVSGDVIFDHSKISPIIQPFAYKCMGNDLIKLIMGTLNKTYADAGYITTQAYIAQQDFSSEIFKIQIVAGKIETIDIAADQPLTKRQIFTAFPIKANDILNMEFLQQGIDNIKKRPSKNVAIKLQPGEQPGTSKVVISAKEQKNWRFNAGSHYTVYKGVSTKSNDATIEVDNILGLNDGWKLTLGGGENNNSLDASVTAPLQWADLTLSSDYSEYLTVLTPTTELFGQSWDLTANIDYTLFRSPNDKVITNFSFTKNKSDRYINNTHLTPQRFSVAELGIKYIKTMGAFSFTGQLEIAKGLNIFNALVDPIAPKISTPRAQFTLLRANTNLTYVVKNIATLSSEWNFQWAPHALYSGQQMNLGGSGATRGAGSAGMNVDMGITTQQKIALQIGDRAVKGLPNFLSKFEPYVFFDAALGKDIANNSKYYAASIGGGLKFDEQYFSFEAIVAKPVFLKGVINPSKATEFKLNASIKF